MPLTAITVCVPLLAKLINFVSLVCLKLRKTSGELPKDNILAWSGVAFTLLPATYQFYNNETQGPSCRHFLHLIIKLDVMCCLSCIKNEIITIFITVKYNCRRIHASGLLRAIYIHDDALFIAFFPGTTFLSPLVIASPNHPRSEKACYAVENKIC